MIRKFVRMMRGHKGQEMIPWNKQQFWFWLAAILIVGGGATFLRENQSTQVVHRNQSFKPDQAKIIRNRIELTRVKELPQMEDSLSASSEALLDQEKQDNSIAQFHNQYSTASVLHVNSRDTNQIQQTSFPQKTTMQRPSLIAPSVFQGTVESSPVEPTTKPIVWFSGSIEKLSQ